MLKSNPKGTPDNDQPQFDAHVVTRHDPSITTPSSVAATGDRTIVQYDNGHLSNLAYYDFSLLKVYLFLFNSSVSSFIDRKQEPLVTHFLLYIFFYKATTKILNLNNKIGIYPISKMK